MVWTMWGGEGIWGYGNDGVRRREKKKEGGGLVSDLRDWEKCIYMYIYMLQRDGNANSYSKNENRKEGPKKTLRISLH